MKRSDGRILTTHTGSLPRPPALTELYVAKTTGKPFDAAELAKAGRAAVDLILKKQADAGIDVANDGEQTRPAFFRFMTDRVTGFGGHWDRPAQQDQVRYPEFQKLQRQAMAGRAAVSQRDQVPMAIGEVKYLSDAPIKAELADFGAALKKFPGAFVENFITAPSPGIIAAALKNQYYDSMEAYLKALSDALRPEYEAIVNAGFVLQLDCPELALERHVTWQDKPLAEFVAFVDQVIAAINAALVNVPKDRVRLHICWGNGESPHDCDVALADILPSVLRAKIGALVLPFATGRQAHEYRTFEKIRLPDDMLLVAGVIDTRSNVIEHPEAVSDRLERVAAVIGDPSRVLAGTDCGFDTNAGAGRVAADVAFAKLAAMRDGARIASGRLFR